MSTATATRTGSTLTVTFPDGTTYSTAGKRAASAVAVSLGCWTSDGTYGVAVHSTVAAAQKNARTQGTPPHPGGAYSRDAQVIPVRDAD